MSSGIRINPQKLTEARLARSYNISQLADLVGVTRQSISKYEQGLSNISTDVLNRISSKLNFPVSFFFKNSTPFSFNNSTVFYRSFKSSEESIRSMIRIKCNWTYQMYHFLNENITMPKLNLPDFDLLLNQGNMTYENIQRIADTLRNYWGLGKGPINNMISILEKNGIIVSGAKIAATKTDACSEIILGTPVVFYDKSLKSSCRIRFSLAHELGHIILHRYVTNEDLKNKVFLEQIEKEANTFASCFLLPNDGFLNDVISISLDYLLYLKEKWKVSLSAIIYKCKELELIDDNQNLSLRKKISYRHWNKVEPLDDSIPYESTKLFKQAIDFLINHSDFTKSDIINIFAFNTKDLSDVVGCNESYWNEDDNYPKFSII